MKKLLWQYILLFLLPIFFYNYSYAQEDKFKAIFIYNFTKYIEWPVNTGSEFIIAIVGKSPIEQELKNIASKMKVGNKIITIKTFSSITEITTAHIIYLSDRTNNLSEAVIQAKELKGLLVCNSPNSCKQGAGINFIVKNGNLGFEISEKNIKTNGLQVNSSLVALGTSID
jgi:hypothetical protein